MKLELGLTESELDEIKYVQELVCQSKQSAASMKNTILEAIRFYRKHKDPIERAERSQLRVKKAGIKTKQDRQLKPDSSQVLLEQSARELKTKRESKAEVEARTGAGPNPKPTTEPATGYRKPHTEYGISVYPAPLKHALSQRDQNQCTARNPNGTRCPKRRWLDFHHITPKKWGGGGYARESGNALSRAPPAATSSYVKKVNLRGNNSVEAL